MLERYTFNGENVSYEQLIEKVLKAVKGAEKAVMAVKDAEKAVGILENIAPPTENVDNDEDDDEDDTVFPAISVSTREGANNSKVETISVAMPWAQNIKMHYNHSVLECSADIVPPAGDLICEDRYYVHYTTGINADNVVATYSVTYGILQVVFTQNVRPSAPIEVPVTLVSA